MNSGLKAENTDNSNKRGRQRAFSDNPVGSRILSALSGRTRKWLAGESGISESSISDYIANGIAKAESAVAIAHALDVSVDWLLTGAAERPYKTGAAPAVSVEDADWVDVPELNIRTMDDRSRGERIGITPIRRDWLNRAFGGGKGLWLARLLSDYAPADLAEGDEVILRDIGEDDLQERQLILWRVHGRLAIGRFSATIRPTEPDGEYWVSPVMIGAEEEDMTPVARILGRPLAPIR